MPTRMIRMSPIGTMKAFFRQARQPTPELNISYKFPEEKDKPEEFNIVVIQECTPVLYDEQWKHHMQTGIM